MKRRRRSKIKVPVINKVNSKDNAPPSNPDHQDVPHSLKEFIKLKQLALTDVADTKKKSKHPIAMRERKDKRPNIKEKIDESLSKNKSRVITKNDKLKKLRQKKKKKFQKLEMKRKLKKLKQHEESTEDNAENMKDLRKEEIKFGEVVHRPPQISVLPRKVTKTGFENRPGRKDDLLLKSLLKGSNYNQEKRTPLTDKRKNLSISDQRQIEVERQKAMMAYKNMKMKNANKYKIN